MGNFKTRYLPFKELPQNVLGRIMSRMWKKRLVLVPDETIAGVKNIELENGVKIYLVTAKSHRKDEFLKKLSGFSIGKYICLEDISGLTTVKHELGHTKQSKKYGWFYLLLVGVYSAVFCNLWDRQFHKKWSSAKRYKWYYSRWTEAEADKLGGVVR
jgi:hypothetical protein